MLGMQVTPCLYSSPCDSSSILLTRACVQICMLASGLYHLFLPQAEKITRRWLSIDLLGVTLGMISGYFPGVYYGFYCFPVRLRGF